MRVALKKPAFVILKAAIAGLSVWFIFNKVNSKTDFDHIIASVKDSLNDPHKVLVFVGVFVLMFFNWLLETAKWKLLLSYIHRTGWLLCYRSVMSGVTVSVLTPNRTGEFAGRVMHLAPGIRVKAAIASVIGSMNQLLITVLAGGIGLLVSIEKFVNDPLKTDMCIALIIITMCLSLYFYFRIPGLSRLAEKFKILKNLKLYTSLFEKYTSLTLLRLSVLSIIRYLVFTFQFMLMLYWFDISMSWQDAMKALSVMYLVLAVVPTIALSEVTIRGSVALYFFTSYTGNSSGILAATTMIWLINLIIPAISGALSAFYFRFNK